MEFKLSFKDILQIDGTVETADVGMIMIGVVASSLGIAFLRVVS